MAISIDTSPALVSGTGSTKTTAAFTPAAGRVLVCGILFENGSAPPDATLTVSNTITPLTWTLRSRRDQSDSSSQGGIAAIYTAVTTTSITNTTVSAVSSQASDAGAIKVWVVNGADTSSPVGAVGEGSSSTQNNTVNGYTSTINNSRGFAVAEEFFGGGNPSSTDTSTPFTVSSHISGTVINKAADTATSGSTVTFNFNGAASGLWGWNWAAVEIKPAAAVQTVTTSAIASAEAFGTLKVNRTVPLTGIASAEAFGTAKLNLKITASGIASAEAFGSPFLGTVITPSGITSAEAFGTATLRLYITTSGIASAEAFGTALIQRGVPQTLTLDGIDSGELFGSPIVALLEGFVFSPPSVEETPAGQGILFARYRLARGISVLKESGVYRQARYPSLDEILAADIFYQGGHLYPVSADEAENLTLAGYGSNLTLEPL